MENRPKDARCDAVRPRDYDRSWGLAEVEFYFDDDCNDKIPLAGNGKETDPQSTVIGNRARNLVASVVASGFRQLEQQTSVTYDYYPNNVADGDLATHFVADCNTLKDGVFNNAATCSEDDWVGFDFGSPKVVKCLKVLQTREDLNACCDPAGSLALDRWNGTDWTTVTWRHDPQDDGSREPVIVSGKFTGMGKCGLADDIEQRSRRESEECAIPLSSVTRTLGHPLCIKHVWCDDLGFEGDCCPLGGIGGTNFNSRCCCSFMSKLPIFTDEIPLADRGQTYNKIDLEYLAIRWTVVLPAWFTVFGAIWFVLINTAEPSVESPNHVYWDRHCRKLVNWFDQEGYMQRFLRNFRIQQEDMPIRRFGKFVTILLISFITGGSLLWCIGAWIMSSILLRGLYLMLEIVKVSKSSYYPGHEHDEIRRHAITQIEINLDQAHVHYPSTLEVVKSFLVSLGFMGQFFGRWVFDLLLFQSLFFIMGLGDNTISPYDIMMQIPRPNIQIMDKFLVDAMRKVLSLLSIWPLTYMEILFFLFNGIPRCKGPSVLFTSMIFMTIVLVLIKFLNYDYFSLYAAARHTVTTTKPSCQRLLCLVGGFGAEAAVFVGVQCSLVAITMFKDLALPIPQNWMCPWDDSIVTFVGLFMIYSLILITLLMVILCANGHFYGQDYIVGPVGRRLGMNLNKLDPDGTGPSGGMIQSDILMASVPTVVGAWVDSWNVKAFLMVERAKIYAEEMRVPHKCENCYEIHVPYADIIRAQSRNVSLSLQALPFGLILGKLCEYMNYPHIYYRGKLMKCLGKVKHSRRSEYAFFGQLMELYFPFSAALLSFIMWIQLNVTILVMTSANLKTVSFNSFLAALIFAFLKGLIVSFGPNLVMYYEGKSVAGRPKIKSIEEEEAEQRRIEKQKLLGIVRHPMPDFRVLLGHLAHGIVPGGMFGGFSVAGELAVPTAGLWIGISAAAIGGTLPIYLYYKTEEKWPSFAIYVLKMLWAILVGGMAFYITTEADFPYRFCLVAMFVAFTFTIFPAVTCFKKRMLDDKGVLMPSVLEPVLFSYRGIPNFLSIISAMFIAIVPSRVLIIKPLDGSEKSKVSRWE